MNKNIIQAGTAADKRTAADLLPSASLEQNGLLAAAIFIMVCLTGCEIFAVIDTASPIVVKSKVSEHRWRVSYNNDRYFMEIITEDSLNVGDTLRLSR